MVVDNLFRGLSRLGKLHPLARPERHNVEVTVDVPYLPTELPEHRLDIYRPRGEGPWPIVLYIHGGGFRILSKDTHWVMGLAFARRGYLVLNINYRLAPEYPFPAAMMDVCSAYQWLLEHAAEHGGDRERIVVAGESAGANLATSLTLATVFPRPERWAREVFDLGVVPSAVVAASGIFQVSDVQRFARRKKLSLWLTDRLDEVSAGYLPSCGPRSPGEIDLADPVVVLEREDVAARPLPPFFLSVGTADPLLDDTRRLKAALDRRGTDCEARYYKGEVHAFQAMVFRAAARRCWSETFAFLDRQLAHSRSLPT